MGWCQKHVDCDGILRVVVAAGDIALNLGDESILLAILTELRARFPRLKLTVLSADSKLTATRHNVDSAYFGMSIFRYPASVLRLICLCLTSDVMIWGGGNLVQDASSLLHPPFHLSKVLIAKLCRLPVFAYGVGIGPTTHRLTRTLTRIALNRLTIITVRDRLAKEAVVACGIDKERVKVMIDPAVGLSPVHVTCRQGITPNTRKRVAIVPRRVFHSDSSLIPMTLKVKLGLYEQSRKQRFAEFIDTLARAADYLVERYNCEIVFIPMYVGPGQDDDQVCAQVRDRMIHRQFAEIAESDLPVKQLLSIYTECYMTIGVRLHSLILSLVQDVPFIAINYTQKGVGFVTELGWNDLSITAEDLTFERLKDRVDTLMCNHDLMKQRMLRRKPELKQRAKDIADEFAAFVSPGTCFKSLMPVFWQFNHRSMHGGDL